LREASFLSKNLRYLLGCFCFACLFCHASFATNSSIGRKIEAQLAHFDKTLNVGIVVKSLASGRIVYARNPRRFYIPASNEKIFIGIAALATLGADYRYPTKVFVKPGSVSKGVLRGNLYITFSGDPSMTSEDLVNLMQQVKEKGILKITGNIVLDDTAVNAKPYGPGWMWDELNTCYATPVNAIILNHNCFTAYIRPVKRLSQKPKVIYSTKTPYIHIKSHLTTLGKSKFNDCDPDLHSDDSNHYRLTGCMQVDAPGLTLQVAVRNPGLYAMDQMRSTLNKLKIKLSGQVLVGGIPRHLKEVGAHYSAPFEELLGHMLKHSDSLYADSFLMTIGNLYHHQPGNWVNGVDAMQSIIRRKFRVNLSLTNMVDASGLSRYNHVTPLQIVQVLASAHRYKQFSRKFMHALAISGKDGTLHYRMTSYRGKIFAKTGTMKNVTSLSGYIKTWRGTYVFSILINGFIKSSQHFKRLENNIVSIIAKG
jgi:D-alanyl-D-alanine carboxypeptidase/D-alanyl-D-alanine-endopeptidase (penicillin-binding protein 4)